MSFTHQQFGDYIVGAWWKSDETCIYNDEKLWDSTDHYPIFTVIQQYEASKYFSARRRKKKWTGCRPKKTTKQKLNSRKL